jgi:hypothetical protein
MPITLLDSDSAASAIGASFRRQRPGPERELIEWFLDELPFRIPHGSRATVFCEPRLESGFPDLVAVVWNVRTTLQWNDARADISRNDLRLVHYIHQVGQCDFDHLCSVFSRGASGSIERLEAAEMIRRVRGSWTTRALSHSFAARRIIAVEAKVNEWAAALEQAVLNTWFASESYVLVPHVPRGNRLVDAAKSLGIGIWSQSDEPKASPPTPCEHLPRSYASWLFNEWAWRAGRNDDEGSP